MCYHDTNHNVNHIAHDKPPPKTHNHPTFLEIPIVCKNNELHNFISKYINRIKDKTTKQIPIPKRNELTNHKFIRITKNRVINNTCVSPQYSFLLIQKLTPVINNNEYKNKFLH